ncbi:MAG: M43 family zinc metalloprotease [Sphingobacteriaceae bacterium]|nr:M43 family zinc metalloprotease [Sphingobacteriaceae bacterium]
MSIKTIYMGLALLVSPFFIQAQTDLQPCGTGLPSKANMDYLRNLDYTLSSPEDTISINIPVTIHIIRSSNGGGGFNETQAYLTICDLNTRMASAGMFFYVPQAINFINDDDYYNAPNYAPLFNMISSNNVPRTVNIYYTNLSQMGLCGFAFYPNSGIGGFQNDGAVVMGFACSQPTGTTLTHEIGHFFNLPHTFDFTSSNPLDPQAELVTRNFNEIAPRLSANCNLEGDGFCDTPADFIGNRWSCPSGRVQLDLNGDRFRPDSSFYMSYSSDICMSRFSAQQITAMRTTLVDTNASRGYLRINPMPNYPLISNAPLQLQPANGDTVIPNQAVFSWQRIPGASLYQIKIYLFNFAVVDTFTADTFYVNRTRDIRPNRTHSWEVRAITGAQLCTPFGGRINFESSNLALNTSQIVSKQALRVYPTKLDQNAVLYIDQLHIGMPLLLQLRDLQGRVLQEATLLVEEEKLSWPMPLLPAGLYLLQLEQAGNRSFHKLVLTD